jgi:hypothetical protein
MPTPSGSKSLIQGIRFLEALHAQLLNVSSAESQQIEAYGVMCPRWAASQELSDAEAKTLFVDVIRRRAIQSAPVLYAIKVLRELLKEHELATSIPASAIPGAVEQREVRISLSREDFGALVRGKIVERDGVKIALQDIGFPLMEAEIAAAQTGSQGE